MKRLFAMVVVAGVALAGARGQEFVAPKPKPADPLVVHTPPNPRPKIEGIVAEIFNVKKPWQLVNPLAPKEYGDGRKMVSYSESDPGKPKGFIVASVEW